MPITPEQQQPANLPATASQPVADNNTTALSMPDFLQQQGAIGLELVKQYIVPPRLRCVQPLSKAPLKPTFQDGDLVVTPSLQLIDKLGTGGFIFTPLFFWPEWVTFNPTRDMPQLPYVRERSMDKLSAIAAKSRNNATREEPCPEDKRYPLKHVEVLNFMISIHNATPIGREPVLLSFQRAEHKAGTTLNALIKMRNAPICGNLFIGTMGMRENNKGRWYGVDCANPPAEIGPWVTDRNLFEEFYAQFLVYKEAYESQILAPDYEAGEFEEGAATNPEM